MESPILALLAFLSRSGGDIKDAGTTVSQSFMELLRNTGGIISNMKFLTPALPMKKPLMLK